MQDLNIHIWQEGEWFLAEVINADRSSYEEEPLYAQGLSYEEVLSNLFSVIRTIKEINEEKKERKSLPNKEITFSIPAFA